MNVLIVGAGAVGLVYGHHLAKAGHNVTFLVKEKYHKDLEKERKKGIVLYQLNNDKQLQSPIRFNNYSVISNWQHANDFDLVTLSISSTALRQLPLTPIKEIMFRSNKAASLLMLQPSEEDLNYLSQVIPQKNILQGMITLISYQTDNINEGISPAGTAYYLPPLAMPISATKLAQKKNNLKETVAVFKESGINAKVVNSALDESRLISAFLMTFLCALEAANWRFKHLKQSTILLKLLSEAQRDLLPQKILGIGLFPTIKRSLLKRLLKPWLYKALIRLAPIIVPLPLEAYLKKHFLKVRPQTLMYMQNYQDRHPSIPVANLVALISD